MDGFEGNEGVIVIAATNRRDILDPALLRPGRFDREVMVGYPDVKGREEILKVHAKNKPLAPDVDLNVIAKTTQQFTGADLETCLTRLPSLPQETTARLSPRQISRKLPSRSFQAPKRDLTSLPTVTDASPLITRQAMQLLHITSPSQIRCTW